MIVELPYPSEIKISKIENPIDKLGFLEYTKNYYILKYPLYKISFTIIIDEKLRVITKNDVVDIYKNYLRKTFCELRWENRNVLKDIFTKSLNNNNLSQTQINYPPELFNDFENANNFKVKFVHITMKEINYKI